MLNPDVKSVKWKLTRCYIMNMNYLCRLKGNKHDKFRQAKTYRGYSLHLEQYEGIGLLPCVQDYIFCQYCTFGKIRISYGF